MAAAVQLVSRAKGSDGEQGTVVDARERFTEGWLHMTATGRRLAELGIAELLVGTGAWFVRGWVTAVDADARTALTDDEQVLPYDTPVYALAGSLTRVRRRAPGTARTP